MNTNSEIAIDSFDAVRDTILLPPADQ